MTPKLKTAGFPVAAQTANELRHTIGRRDVPADRAVAEQQYRAAVPSAWTAFPPKNSSTLRQPCQTAISADSRGSGSGTTMRWTPRCRLEMLEGGIVPEHGFYTKLA